MSTLSTLTATAAAISAPGVEYTEAHGLRMFRCEPHSATLTITGCAKRWRESQGSAEPAKVRGRSVKSSPERCGGPPESEALAGIRCASSSLNVCRACPIGAAHAGAPVVRYSWMFGSGVCPRCDVGGARMIGNRRCISCYNREREMALGRNARGNIPAELLATSRLRPVSLHVIVDGQVHLKRADAVDVREPVVHVLRTTKGALAFAFAGAGVQRRAA